MLKFKSYEDKVHFLIEVNALEYVNTTENDLPQELAESFFSTNKLRTHKIVDFRKSQTTSHQWNVNRWAMMKGIHKFHRSIAGKRLHRSLGRFLATRVFEPHRLRVLPSLRSEAAKAISSVRTHFYIESQYYRPLSEDVEFEVLMQYSIPLLASCERKVYEDRVDEITPDELELLFRLTEFSELVKAFKEYQPDAVYSVNESETEATYFLSEFFAKKYATC